MVVSIHHAVLCDFRCDAESVGIFGLRVSEEAVENQPRVLPGRVGISFGRVGDLTLVSL